MESKSPGGFGADLRRFLSDLFLGGAWDERQEQTFEILFRLLGHLSRLDGTVSPEERKLASRVMIEIGVPIPLHERALEAFDTVPDGGVNLKAELTRYLEVFRTGSPQLATLRECLERLAHADGRVDTRERAFLDELNQALGISDYEERLRAIACMPMY
jgi:hypothetical protein